MYSTYSPIHIWLFKFSISIVEKSRKYYLQDRVCIQSSIALLLMINMHSYLCKSWQCINRGNMYTSNCYQLKQVCGCVLNLWKYYLWLCRSGQNVFVPTGRQKWGRDMMKSGGNMVSTHIMYLYFSEKKVPELLIGEETSTEISGFLFSLAWTLQRWFKKYGTVLEMCLFAFFWHILVLTNLQVC